jgi:hypothetical protein
MTGRRPYCAVLLAETQAAHARASRDRWHLQRRLPRRLRVSADSPVHLRRAEAEVRERLSSADGPLSPSPH